MTYEDRERDRRRDEVLAYLRAADGEWIDGTELATQRVGGSEGGRRRRELVAMGYLIEKRRHPNPHRHCWQYRLIAEPAEPDRTGLWEWRGDDA